MHSNRLADPLVEVTRTLKALTSKRKRTEADEQRIARLEWEGGLNVDEKGRPILTSEQIEAVIRDAARVRRLGKDAVRGILVEEHSPIDFAGRVDGMTLDALYERNCFRVGTRLTGGRVTVMRTRPIFRSWSASIAVTLIDFDRRVLDEILPYAGKMIGAGDWRPKYGRFEVEAIA
jgi:hypothetical protein